VHAGQQVGSLQRRQSDLLFDRDQTSARRVFLVSVEAGAGQDQPFFRSFKELAENAGSFPLFVLHLFVQAGRKPAAAG